MKMPKISGFTHAIYSLREWESNDARGQLWRLPHARVSQCLIRFAHFVARAVPDTVSKSCATKLHFVLGEFPYPHLS